MTTIAIINKSSLIPDNDGALMTKACQQQLTNHASKLLGRLPWNLLYVPKAGSIVAPADAFPLVLLDDPDHAGALGYHTEDPNGRVWGRVFAKPVLSNGGTMLNGSLSVSTVLSHEVLETFVDKSVNFWADKLDGKTMIAMEIADPVENDSYTVQVSTGVLSKNVAVSVSNFVTDAWFDPQAPANARRDFMNTTPGPLMMSKGGYVVELNYTTGKVSNVFGSKEAEFMHQMKKPSHPAARSARRAAHYS